MERSGAYSASSALGWEHTSPPIHPFASAYPTPPTRSAVLRSSNESLASTSPRGPMPYSPPRTQPPQTPGGSSASSTRPPSSKRALAAALELAQEAIRIDAAGEEPLAAIAAYGKSITLLKEVMDRVMRGEGAERRRAGVRRRSDAAREDEVRRLKSIHDTYADRMQILSFIYQMDSGQQAPPPPDLSQESPGPKNSVETCPVEGEHESEDTPTPAEFIGSALGSHDSSSSLDNLAHHAARAEYILSLDPSPSPGPDDYDHVIPTEYQPTPIPPTPTNVTNVQRLQQASQQQPQSQLPTLPQTPTSLQHTPKASVPPPPITPTTTRLTAATLLAGAASWLGIAPGRLRATTKLVDITFDGVTYTSVDLTRHTNAKSLRKDIISRIPPATSSFSTFDIFRTHPPGSKTALNNAELMLNVERFGDGHGSLKFHVKAVHRHSDSNSPAYVQTETTQAQLKHVNSTNVTVALHREMTASEILKHLNDHHCKDMTAQLGGYEVGKYPISSGGFGDVYRATHSSGHRVGLKCVRLHIDATDDGWKKLKSAARELHTWSKCQHPNILELIGVTEHCGQLAMVSPWMENGDLNRFLSRNPRPEVNRCLLCVQIADGVSYLHQNGIVHGDLKGANVLLSDDLTPKIIDFGGACIKDCTLRFSTSADRSGFSVRWAAPEIIEDRFKDTPAGADVYSLAMTILCVIPTLDLKLTKI